MIETAIRDREKLLRLRKGTDRSLQGELARAGAANVSDTEEQNFTRERLVKQVDLARPEIELHAPAAIEREDGVQPLTDYMMTASILPALQEVQVIVRSCREQVFGDLGGQQSQLKAGKTNELMSA